VRAFLFGVGLQLEYPWTEHSSAALPAAVQEAFHKMPCCATAAFLDEDDYDPPPSVQQGAVAITPSEETAIAIISGPEASTYGEITPHGFESLGRRCNLGPVDCFADLGSGLGLCTMQAASSFDVRCACGIELCMSRHKLAVAAAALASSRVSSRVTFVQGDCADPRFWQPADALLNGVTVLYVSSLLFSSELMSRIAAQIVSSPGGQSIRIVATLKRFRWRALRRAGFRLRPASEPCEMSWAASQPVYLYERPAAVRGGQSTKATTTRFDAARSRSTGRVAPMAVE
jgi:hypothetical protein